MTTEETALQIKLARVNASIARALIRMEGMKAENQIRIQRQESLAHWEDDFLRIIDEECIGCNEIIKETSV